MLNLDLQKHTHTKKNHPPPPKKKAKTTKFLGVESLWRMNWEVLICFSFFAFQTPSNPQTPHHLPSFSPPVAPRRRRRRRLRGLGAEAVVHPGEETQGYLKAQTEKRSREFFGCFWGWWFGRWLFVYLSDRFEMFEGIRWYKMVKDVEVGFLMLFVDGFWEPEVFVSLKQSGVSLGTRDSFNGRPWRCSWCKNAQVQSKSSVFKVCWWKRGEE